MSNEEPNGRFNALRLSEHEYGFLAASRTRTPPTVSQAGSVTTPLPWDGADSRVHRAIERPSLLANHPDSWAGNLWAS